MDNHFHTNCPDDAVQMKVIKRRTDEKRVKPEKKNRLSLFADISSDNQDEAETLKTSAWQPGSYLAYVPLWVI